MILGIEDDWAAYQLDVAAMIAAADSRPGRKAKPAAGKFAALKGRARKGRVPDSGVW